MKILILSIALIALVGISAFLVSISVNPTNASNPNAKRESVPTSGNSRYPAVLSGSNMARQALTVPNAKREEI